MKTQEQAAQPGNLLFILVFLLFAVILLLQLGTETKFSSTGKLFAQPRFWPAVGVIGMVLFGLAQLAVTISRIATGKATDNVTGHTPVNSDGIAVELLTWARSLEYLLWFMLYVSAVPIVGYLAATIIFTVLLALRMGYRDRKQIFAAAMLGTGIVLVFKTGLSVKIPGGAVYEYLPAALRNFMIVNF